MVNKTIKISHIIIVLLISIAQNGYGTRLLIPMDNKQADHLKAYGIAYWTLEGQVDVQWLLNYRGGSFMIAHHKEIESECVIRGVSYEVISDAEAGSIIGYIAREDVNMDAVKLEKAPKIAVYSPPGKQPWDDAVTLVLNYAEIPHDIIYDPEIVDGKLSEYDWLHLHHEDFTGQYGKFWAGYHNTTWYQQQVSETEEMARSFGFEKVSQLKLFVAKAIKAYVRQGGFLFAMCSATDTYDIALSAEGVDICAVQFDGDPVQPDAQQMLNYDNCLAFENFQLSFNPTEYEHSNIDVSQTRRVPQAEDYFTLFDFSAKWDPVPTMLTQCHTNIVPGFMGQSTAYDKALIKPEVLIMGENKAAGEARYIHGEYEQGTWTFYGGHDPEDYRHYVNDPPTELKLHPNSPGYRLILNNVLFPAARKKKIKT